jgi:anti-sigma regulatory factor (Ser/Thr protein kinase)
MHTMVPGREAELHACRVRLAPGPAAAAEARGQVRAAIAAWDAPVDPDVAVLLTSELVTNAVRHAAGETVMLGIRRARDRLRVDVYDTSRALPMREDTPADAEAGRGLVLVDELSAEWGFYRTPAGKAVYFTLAFQPDPAVPAPRPAAEPDRPGTSWQHHEPERDTDEPRGPCKQCGGLGGTHYLTCRSLRRPRELKRTP